MSRVVLDDFGTVAPWRARTAGGGPSTAIRIEPGTARRLGPGTARFAADAGAAGHRLERTIAAADLTAQTDLQIWILADRAADGTEGHPFFLELRLGSATAPASTGPGSWHRLLPIAAAGGWLCVPVSLGDLPPAVRSAVSEIRFTCVDGRPFSAHLDAIAAVRDEMLVDVEEALVRLLGDRLRIDGALVPGVIVPAATLPDEPYLRISNIGIRPAPERSATVPTRSDYTQTGFSLRPPTVAYDLTYSIRPVAADRAPIARMLDFVLGEIAPSSTLVVNDRPLAIDWAEPPAAPSGAPDDFAVHLTVSAQRRSTAGYERAVPPFNLVEVEVDQRATA
jgi:hypothetical protein